MTLELVVDGSQVTQKALAFPDQARALTISDTATYQQACDFLLGVKALRAEIAETFDPHIGRAFEAHRALCREKKEAEAPLADAELIVKRALVTYDTAQERIRQEEQRRLQEQARREAEERQLMEAIALEEEAKASGDAGLAMEAAAKLEEPIHTPAVAVAPTTPKVSGIAYRETWSGRLTNIAALIVYAASNPQFMGLLMINQPALNQLARSMKNQMRIPGVEAVSTKDVAAGRR
jgi:hypothetical protein